MERLNMGSDPIPTQIRRHSMPIQAGRGPPSNAGRAPPPNGERGPPLNAEGAPPLTAGGAPPPNVGRGPLLHLADLAVHPRPSSGPVAAVMARVQQPASDATRFNLESVDISQFGSEAEVVYSCFLFSVAPPCPLVHVCVSCCLALPTGTCMCVLLLSPVHWYMYVCPVA